MLCLGHYVKKYKCLAILVKNTIKHVGDIKVSKILSNKMNLC